MKRFILISLMISGAVFSVHAQKLVYAGKPKAVKVEGLSGSFCADLPNQTSVCKGRDLTDEGSGRFFIRQKQQKTGEIDAAGGLYSRPDQFFAYYGDLDRNKSAELVIVDFDSQGLGLGVSYYTINIFPDFQTKGFQTPLRFGTTEFGVDGTFVYDAKRKETLILLTDFYSSENISKKDGTYFIGRFFRLQNGLLKPATDKPIYARRYLYSFENQRFRTAGNPLRPWLWLNSNKALKLRADPEFLVKPFASETGVVEKFETITEKLEKAEEGTNVVHVKQVIVKMSSGDMVTIVIQKKPDDVGLDSDAGKMFPEVFGLLPAMISLPRDLDISLVLGDLTGKKVVINKYPPFEFDELKMPRYKVLFYE